MRSPSKKQNQQNSKYSDICFDIFGAPRHASNLEQFSKATVSLNSRKCHENIFLNCNQKLPSLQKCNLVLYHIVYTFTTLTFDMSWSLLIVFRYTLFQVWKNPTFYFVPSWLNKKLNDKEYGDAITESNFCLPRCSII